MAILKPGPLAAAISGPVGGTQFVASSSGPQVRARPAKCNAQTAPQLATRARMGRAQILWAALTTPQKHAWSTAAAVKPLPNRLGVLRNISGHQLFLRQTLYYLARALTPPTYPGNLIVSPWVGQAVETTIAGQYWTVGSLTPPVPGPYNYAVRAVITPNTDTPPASAFLSGPVVTHTGILDNHTSAFVAIYGPTQPGKYFHFFITSTVPGYLPSPPLYAYDVMA